MTQLEEIAKDLATGFEQIRRDKLGVNSKMLLLKEEGEEEGKPFKVLRYVTRNFCPSSNDFFGTMTLKVGDISEAFGNDARRATHFILQDTIIPALNNVIHEFSSRTAGPDTSKPFWRIRGESQRTLYVDAQEQ